MGASARHPAPPPRRGPGPRFGTRFTLAVGLQRPVRRPGDHGSSPKARRSCSDRARDLQGGLALLAVLAMLFAAHPAAAQSLTVDLGAEGSLSLRSVQLLVLVTVLSLVPGLAVMITCFPFIVTVLSILRQAIGLQQSPLCCINKYLILLHEICLKEFSSHNSDHKSFP